MSRVSFLEEFESICVVIDQTMQSNGATYTNDVANTPHLEKARGLQSEEITEQR